MLYIFQNIIIFKCSEYKQLLSRHFTFLFFTESFKSRGNRTGGGVSLVAQL